MFSSFGILHRRLNNGLRYLILKIDAKTLNDDYFSMLLSNVKIKAQSMSLTFFGDSKKINVEQHGKIIYVKIPKSDVSDTIRSSLASYAKTLLISYLLEQKNSEKAIKMAMKTKKELQEYNKMMKKTQKALKEFVNVKEQTYALVQAHKSKKLKKTVKTNMYDYLTYALIGLGLAYWFSNK